MTVSRAPRGRVPHRRLLTQEEVVGVRARPTNLEYLHHIKELAVDVADNRHGRSDVHHIALLHEQLLGLCTYCLDDGLGEQLLLGQAGYAFIQVHAGCKVSVCVLARTGAD